MTIDEAIQFNREVEKDFRDKRMPTIADAVKLGKEALEFVKKGRRQWGGPFLNSLPGETE